MQDKASCLFNTEDERYIYFFPVCYMSDVNQRYIVNKYLVGHSASEIGELLISAGFVSVPPLNAQQRQ